MGGDEDFDDIYDVVPWIPPNYRKVWRDFDADQVAAPRVFKTHCLYVATPKVEGATRFVITIRDPYDAQLPYVKFAWRLLGDDRDTHSDAYFNAAVALVCKLWNVFRLYT